MKRVECAAVVLLAGFVVGCGGAGDGKSSGSGLEQPKYPDVYVEVRDPSGHAGGSPWHLRDDGSAVYRGNQGTGENFGYSQEYVGTSVAGDKYVFNIRRGDAEETKEVVYAGKEVTVDLGDGVSILLKPRK